MTKIQPQKVLVSGHDQKFWYPLQAKLEATGLFEFREDLWTGHDQHNPEKTLELLEWADIIVAEWTLGNAVFCAKHKKPHQRLVTRLHLQERGTNFPAELNYENVDLVIFVGPHILEECVEKFKMPRDKVCVIGNFLDFKKYDRPKFGGTEFNLGLIGIVPSRKRLDLAVDTLRHLLEKDSRYMLHVKGPSPQSYNWLWARTKEREYYQEIFHTINSSELKHKVVFDPAGNDVDSWFQKIGYLLSPSDFESFHMAVAEGMCSGAVPVVWNWEGASSIYPLLELPSTTKQAADFIHILATSNSRHKLSTQSKQFIQENYDTDLIMSKWVKALLPSPKLTLSTSSLPLIEKKAVIIVYAIDSWETFHRREMLEALAKNLKDKANILIIEPGSHYKTLLDKQVCTETELNNFAKLKPCKVSDNIHKIRILQGSMPESAGAIAKLKNAGSYEKAIQVATQHIFGTHASIVHWIYKPDQKKLAYGNQPYIYEVYDEYTMDFGTGVVHKSVAEAELEVLRHAAHVFFTSEPLAERKKTYCTSWSVVGNGVAFDIFETYQCKSVPQTGMRKSIGYLGNLSDFFDWALMAEVCKRMPSCDFFFHGQIEHHRLEAVKHHVEELLSMPNTYFSGRITRPVGAAAINRYDALIIPFVINDAMHAVNPLKLWEYFATGKPVVSTPMDAIKVETPLLRVANCAELWVDALNESINETNPQCSAERISLAKDNSWEKLTTNHASILINSI
jgi:glycosyltransferase involved in cell wall biosynthesis